MLRILIFLLALLFNFYASNLHNHRDVLEDSSCPAFVLKNIPAQEIHVDIRPVITTFVIDDSSYETEECQNLELDVENSSIRAPPLRI